jgi:hypothetical protein
MKPKHNTYIVIEGTKAMYIQKESLSDAITFAQNYCDLSKEIIVREIQTTRNAMHYNLLNKDLLILALETLEEQVEYGTLWDCPNEAKEGDSRLSMIKDNIDTIKCIKAISKHH